MRCSLLKLLTILAESGPGGFDTVTNALDHVKVKVAGDERINGGGFVRLWDYNKNAALLIIRGGECGGVPLTTPIPVIEKWV